MDALNDPLIDHFRNKHFLFVLGQYTNMGGAERQAIILASELKKLSINISFLAWGGNGVINKTLQELGIPCHTLPLTWNQGKAKQLLSLVNLTKLIRYKIKPDYLLPYIGFNCKVTGLIWKLCNVKFTWWNQRDEGREVFGSSLEKRIMKSVPGIVSNSYEGRDFLIKCFELRPESIAVINNGIPLPQKADRFYWRKRLNLNSDHFLISMVANLTEYKDHLTLLRAFAELRKSDLGTRCHLCLAGSHGATIQAVKSLAFDLRLADCVHLPGAVQNVSDLWSATDLAVHSSIKEGCPNAVLEAMSHSLAVCGTNISGIRQALGENGTSFLAEPGNYESLADILAKLLQHDSVRQTLGTENRKRIEQNFSPQLLMTTVLNYIKKKSL